MNDLAKIMVQIILQLEQEDERRQLEQGIGFTSDSTQYNEKAYGNLGIYWKRRKAVFKHYKDSRFWAFSNAVHMIKYGTFSVTKNQYCISLK